MAKAKTVAEVIAGEANPNDPRDIQAIAEIIDNRAKALGVTPEQVVSALTKSGTKTYKQFDAYDKNLPPGIGAKQIAEAQRVFDEVQAGTVARVLPSNTTFYAQSWATGNLPKNLKMEIALGPGSHLYFSDPLDRRIKVNTKPSDARPDRGYKSPQFAVPTPRERPILGPASYPLVEAFDRGAWAGAPTIYDAIPSAPARERPEVTMPRGGPFSPMGGDTYQLSGYNPVRDQLRSVPRARPTPPDTYYGSTGIPRERPSDHMRAGVGIPPYGFEDRMASALSVADSWDRQSVPMPRSRPSLGPGPAEAASIYTATSDASSYGRPVTTTSVPPPTDEFRGDNTYGQLQQGYKTVADPVNLDYGLGYGIGDDYQTYSGQTAGGLPAQTYNDLTAGNRAAEHAEAMPAPGEPVDAIKAIMDAGLYGYDALATPDVLTAGLEAGLVTTPELPVAWNTAPPVAPVAPVTPVAPPVQTAPTVIGKPMNIVPAAPLPGLQTMGSGYGGIGGTGISMFSPDTFVNNTINNVLKSGGSGVQAMDAARSARAVAQPGLYGGGGGGGAANAVRGMNEYNDLVSSGLWTGGTGLGVGYDDNSGHSMGW
jgi:hypothetical protein